MIALILGRLISMTTGVRYLPHDFILIYPPKQKLGGYQKGTKRYFDISYIITKYAHNSKFDAVTKKLVILRIYIYLGYKRQLEMAQYPPSSDKNKNEEIWKTVVDEVISCVLDDTPSEAVLAHYLGKSVESKYRVRHDRQ